MFHAFLCVFCLILTLTYLDQVLFSECTEFYYTIKVYKQFLIYIKARRKRCQIKNIQEQLASDSGIQSSCTTSSKFP